MAHVHLDRFDETVTGDRLNQLKCSPRFRTDTLVLYRGKKGSGRKGSPEMIETAGGTCCLLASE